MFESYKRPCCAFKVLAKLSGYFVSTEIHAVNRWIIPGLFPNPITTDALQLFFSPSQHTHTTQCFSECPQGLVRELCFSLTRVLGEGCPQWTGRHLQYSLSWGGLEYLAGTTIMMGHNSEPCYQTGPCIIKVIYMYFFRELKKQSLIIN